MNLLKYWYLRFKASLTFTDNSYQPWTVEEVHLLQQLVLDGFSDEDISHVLMRSPQAIYQKRMKLKS